MEKQWSNRFLKLKYVSFPLLKSKNETQPSFRKFKWIFFGITYGTGRERERGSEEREEREKDEGQVSNATPGTEMSVCEVLRVYQ